MIMKKIFTGLTLIILAATILLLVSCNISGEPKTANEFYAKVNSVMNELDSYEIEGVTELLLYMDGNKIKSTAETNQIIAGNNSEDFYFYSNTRTSMTAKSLGINRTFSSRDAFYNGIVYVISKGANFTQRFYSPMTAEEFVEFYYSKSIVFSADSICECMNTSLVHNEDGSWVASFSGYTKKVLEPYLESMGFEDGVYDNDILDMEITITADSIFTSRK